MKSDRLTKLLIAKLLIPTLFIVATVGCSAAHRDPADKSEPAVPNSRSQPTDSPTNNSPTSKSGEATNSVPVPITVPSTDYLTASWHGGAAADDTDRHTTTTIQVCFGRQRQLLIGLFLASGQYQSFRGTWVEEKRQSLAAGAAFESRIRLTIYEPLEFDFRRVRQVITVRGKLEQPAGKLHTGQLVLEHLRLNGVSHRQVALTALPHSELSSTVAAGKAEGAIERLRNAGVPIRLDGRGQACEVRLHAGQDHDPVWRLLDTSNRWEKLQLSGVRLTQSKWQMISGWKQLRAVSCRAVAGSLDLASLPAGLWELSIVQADLTNADCADLRRLQQLRQLNLTATLIDDGALAYIGKLPKIRRLELDATLIRGAGLGQLAQLPDLRELSLRFIDLDEQFVEQLRSLSQLRVLRLQGVQLSTKVMETLSQLSHLQQLELSGTQLPEPARTKLTVAIPDTQVQFDE